MPLVTVGVARTLKNPYCSMAVDAEDTRSKFAAFIGNGDVSILVKNSRVGLKTPTNQTKEKPNDALRDKFG